MKRTAKQKNTVENHYALCRTGIKKLLKILLIQEWRKQFNLKNLQYSQHWKQLSKKTLCTDLLKDTCAVGDVETCQKYKVIREETGQKEGKVSNLRIRAMNNEFLDYSGVVSVMTTSR